MKSFNRLLILAIMAVALVSCEEQEYFKSESEIKKELAFSWKQILMGQDPVYEVWTFKESKLYFQRFKVSDNSPLDSMSGDFSVNTTLTKVFVTTSGFPDDEAWHQLNAEWTVVLLNNKVLSIASEDSYGGGVFQREFTRID